MVVARSAALPREADAVARDPDLLRGYLEDASGNPPGYASGLLRPASEEEASAFLAATAGRGVAVLPQAARSSLTGGAVPRGEVVVSVERLATIGPVRGSTIEVGAGVRLRDLQASLRQSGYYYPPVPTYQEAMVGGTVSTNAGGSASFKYGVTRHWVHGLRVLLGNGDVLEIERGQAVVERGGTFRIRLGGGGELAVPAPAYEIPKLKKMSAGYFASDPLDLVDLLVGSEGTLGVITAATLDLVPLPPALVVGLVFSESMDRAMSLVSALRVAAIEARERRDPEGPDIRAIEILDGRCLDLLRKAGTPARLRVTVPEDARAALVFEMELPRALTNAESADAIAAALEGREDTGPLARLLRILGRHGALETVELALPEDRRRQESLAELREAVPKRVNELLLERRRADAGVRKTGGDLIVPFEHLADMIRIYEQGFRKRGLDYALWGHVSDGNLHPNAIARNAAEVEAGNDALFEFAREAAARGGCPLSEHGVGRSPVKQEMLRRFLGDGAIESMRAAKRGLDPEGRFAPGVIFPTSTAPSS
jgi:D-lactate dehydrogenase (cytochrome)